jgi:putative transposase
MYDWRKMTEIERHNVLKRRKFNVHPWHSPPHRFPPGKQQYLITAACFEHAPIVGSSPERMDQFADALLETATKFSDQLYAWCVLPNHYHMLLRTKQCPELLAQLARLHGKTSHQWNGEDATRGRKVWFGIAEREMRTERHLWASVNYVHHNPVKHGYATRWQEWPWGSARSYLEDVGKDRAEQVWKEYPVKNYGAHWDD